MKKKVTCVLFFVLLLAANVVAQDNPFTFDALPASNYYSRAYMPQGMSAEVRDLTSLDSEGVINTCPQSPRGYQPSWLQPGQQVIALPSPVEVTLLDCAGKLNRVLLKTGESVVTDASNGDILAVVRCGNKVVDGRIPVQQPASVATPSAMPLPVGGAFTLTTNGEVVHRVQFDGLNTNTIIRKEVVHSGEVTRTNINLNDDCYGSRANKLRCIGAGIRDTGIGVGAIMAGVALNRHVSNMPNPGEREAIAAAGATRVNQPITWTSGQMMAGSNNNANTATSDQAQLQGQDQSNQQEQLQGQSNEQQQGQGQTFEPTVIAEGGEGGRGGQGGQGGRGGEGGSGGSSSATGGTGGNPVANGGEGGNGYGGEGGNSSSGAIATGGNSSATGGNASADPFVDVVVDTDVVANGGEGGSGGNSSATGGNPVANGGEGGNSSSGAIATGGNASADPFVEVVAEGGNAKNNNNNEANSGAVAGSESNSEASAAAAAAAAASSSAENNGGGGQQCPPDWNIIGGQCKAPGNPPARP